MQTCACEHAPGHSLTVWGGEREGKEKDGREERIVEKENMRMREEKGRKKGREKKR